MALQNRRNRYISVATYLLFYINIYDTRHILFITIATQHCKICKTKIYCFVQNKYICLLVLSYFIPTKKRVEVQQGRNSTIKCYRYSLLYNNIFIAETFIIIWFIFYNIHKQIPNKRHLRSQFFYLYQTFYPSKFKVCIPDFI